MSQRIMIGMAAYRGIQCIPCLDTLEGTTRLLMENGHHVSFKMIEGSPYIQTARNELLRLFMNEDHDIFLAIDDDISFPAETVLEFINKEDEFLAGIYPQKTDPPSWPIVINTDIKGFPLVREDGYVSATRVPGGFVCLKRSCVKKMYDSYQSRFYTDRDSDGVEIRVCDLFPQGLKNDGRWIGEDFAFCDLWTSILGQIWIKPNINFCHYKFKNNISIEYAGNYHEYLKSLPKEEKT